MSIVYEELINTAAELQIVYLNPKSFQQTRFIQSVCIRHQLFFTNLQQKCLHCISIDILELVTTIYLYRPTCKYLWTIFDYFKVLMGTSIQIDRYEKRVHNAKELLQSSLNRHLPGGNYHFIRFSSKRRLKMYKTSKVDC